MGWIQPVVDYVVGAFALEEGETIEDVVIGVIIAAAIAVVFVLFSKPENRPSSPKNPPD